MENLPTANIWEMQDVYKRQDYYRELLSQLGLGLEDMMGSK